MAGASLDTHETRQLNEESIRTREVTGIPELERSTKGFRRIGRPRLITYTEEFRGGGGYSDPAFWKEKAEKIAKIIPDGASAYRLGERISERLPDETRVINCCVQIVEFYRTRRPASKVD